MPPVSACPDENELVRFARGGREAGGGAEALVAHLDGCASCRRAVAEAASDVPLLAPVPASGVRVGRYEVDALVGAGAMGAVFSAKDTALHRRVALKLLHVADADDESSRVRLEREAQAMARLNHPNVVTVYELGDWAGGRFIAMELVDGTTLDAWLSSASPVVRRRVLRDAGQGLAAAHQAGVVHRDFKPHNLLVGADGRVRVTDFGLSRPLPLGDAATKPGLFATAQGALVGTPAWMSPEQLDGRSAEARSDQYAFCVVWVEALTGRRPFMGATREALREAMRGRPDLGRELSVVERKVMARGLAEAPEARFESVGALLEALSPRARRRWPLAVGAVVLAAGAGVAWLEQPASTGAPTEVPRSAALSMHLAVGESQQFGFECMSRLAVSDPAVVDVLPSDGGLSLTGLAPGRTTVLAWRCDGGRAILDVQVDGPQR
jgi:serine/threonine-protein kinase